MIPVNGALALSVFISGNGCREPLPRYQALAAEIVMTNF